MMRSIVLPAYNESGYIAEMVRRTISACETRDDPFEVIVIDNASTDNTAEIVEAIASSDARVRVIRHPENRLYAGSCATGSRAALGDRVFILDSDGQHVPSDIWTIDRKLADGFDLVLGWRRSRAETRLRLAVSRVLWLLTRLYVGYSMHDVNCGIRGMSRRFVDALHIAHRVNMVNPELYTRATLGGFRVGEVEVVQEARKAGASTHDFNKLWRIFLDTRVYLKALRVDLKSRVDDSAA